MHYRCGESPLLSAVQRDDVAMIDLLTKCGGHLSSNDSKSVCEMLSLASRSGAVRKLESLVAAGANLNLCDELNQTALHKVSCGFFLTHF